jgi:glycosyltransferase involved in cell wall biosynthesis
MADRSLGLVVPAYRPDVDRLVAYVRACRSALDPAAVRIELDAPTAGTADTLRQALPEVLVSVAPERRGKGAAITAGFEALTDAIDVLAFADADGSTPPESLRSIVEPVLDDRADLAVGSRRHPESEVVGHQTFARRRLGDAFAWLARRLLDADCYDYQCGAKAVSADAWETVRPHLYEAGFAWDVELIAMAGALGLRVLEVPIEWEDQPGSTVDPVDTAVSLGTALFVARHRAKRLQDSRLHDAIARRRADETALVDRTRDGS